MRAGRSGRRPWRRANTILRPVRFASLAAIVLCLNASVPAAQEPAGRPPADVAPDAFARREWHLELGTNYSIETWNYNNSHETLTAVESGVSYGLRDGLVLRARWPLYYVDQRGVDGCLLGATIGVRGRIYRRSRVSVFLELDVGVSEADTAVPPRGTRFNYLVLGGAGTTVRLMPGVHLVSGLRWIHVSNSGIAGRSRNPDIEAVGPHLGVLLGF